MSLPARGAQAQLVVGLADAPLHAREQQAALGRVRLVCALAQLYAVGDDRLGGLASEREE